MPTNSRVGAASIAKPDLDPDSNRTLNQVPATLKLRVNGSYLHGERLEKDKKVVSGNAHG